MKLAILLLALSKIAAWIGTATSLITFGLPVVGFSSLIQTLIAEKEGLGFIRFFFALGMWMTQIYIQAYYPEFALISLILEVLAQIAVWSKGSLRG